MRRVLGVVVVLAVSSLGLFVPTAAAPDPVRSLAVTGTDVVSYPAFDPAIRRYAATTTVATDGTLEITATTTDPDGVVLVDDAPATGPTTVSGLAEGDEVSVVIDDAAGRATYSVMYLPAGFPALHATTRTPDQEEPGLIGLTLNAFDGVQPAFGAIVDRNGVPVYAVDGPWDTDLKQQPNGDVTVSRLTRAGGGHTGYALVTLDRTDRSLPEEPTSYEVTGGLTDTDGHDSIRLADGSTILIGYEPRGDCGTGYLDATIQKLDPAGNVVFQWTSAGLESEALSTILWPNSGPCQRIDYAHINSVVSVEDGDIIASFRHFSAAFRIATVAHDGYGKGDIVWKLGGRDSDFVFDGADDAYPGGPCAQHTVSQLPNGNIVVFDNGTSGFCVDPANPAAPGIARGQTRVTEYDLDTSVTPHRATLVWSYAPPGTYAMFAGSARRLEHGNTLIGWAADRSALATEVDDQGQTVWELKAADPPVGKQRYATYRAELITALRPEVIGPADGAVLVQGSSAPAAGCADWAGSPLASCTTTGVTAGHLDTSTVGVHTWTVLGTDGAGNVTTASRAYTVRPPAWVPDGLIRKAGASSWRGADVYGSAIDQTVRQRARRGHVAASTWTVQNDGDRTDRFRLVGTGSNARWKVRYLAAGTDVTRAVVAGTYRTAALAPGQAVALRVRVTPTRSARAGSTRAVVLRATSTTSATGVDAVATRVTVRR